MSGFLSKIFGREETPSKRRSRTGVERTGGSRAEFAVIGLGRFGSSLGIKLVERGFTVLGIDSDMDLVQKYSTVLSQTVRLDTTDEEALRQAEVRAYDVVIVAIGANFEASLMTTVALRKLECPNIICKAATEIHRDLLLNVGAHRVILPEFEAGEHLAWELSLPGLVDDLMLDDKLYVCALEVPSLYVGEDLLVLDLERRKSLQLLGVFRQGVLHKDLGTSWMLEADDLLLVSGRPEAIVKFS